MRRGESIAVAHTGFFLLFYTIQYQGAPPDLTGKGAGVIAAALMMMMKRGDTSRERRAALPFGSAAGTYNAVGEIVVLIQCGPPQDMKWRGARVYFAVCS